jgi:predicted extracellular nuclease
VRKIIIALILSCFSITYGQSSFKAGVIAFYNLENLFDTVNTEGVDDEEFTPDGLNKWTSERYLIKINRMAEAISRIGEDDGIKGGPAILGVSEIENRQVLEDLVAHPLLKASNYQIVHYDSPDLRGVDVALLYQPRYFRVMSSESPELVIFNENRERVYTRDQLVVTGNFDGETISVIVNHWPSRSSGEAVTKQRRNEAATLTRRLADSLLSIDRNAKIIVMGDLNDDPVNESLRKYLRASDNPDMLMAGDLYNCMYPLFKKGVGSLYYRDGMNLFDQIIVSGSLLGKDYSTYRFFTSRVFNKPFLVQQDGQYKDYPLRTYVGTSFLGGYSDHFPVYILLVRERR